MIEKIFFFLAALGILFLIISIKWQSITFGGLSIIMWFGCAAGAYYYEIPYVYSNLGTVYEETQVISDMYLLAGIFLLMGLISMLHEVILVFDLLKGRKPKLM